jgi:hypothetical protein
MECGVQVHLHANHSKSTKDPPAIMALKLALEQQMACQLMAYLRLFQGRGFPLTATAKTHTGSHHSQLQHNQKHPNADHKLATDG